MKLKLVFEKEMNGCYVASHIYEDNIEKIVFASETEKTGKTITIEPDTFEEKVLMDGPGGCMGIIPVPNNGFLAITKFFPIFKSEDAEIVWYRKQGNEYVAKTVAILPFTHRIDIIKTYGEYYLIAAQLCKSKQYTDDWSTAGSIYAGKINFDKEYIEDFRPIYDGIYKNHGYTKIPGETVDSFIISGEMGVLKFTPDKNENGIRWNKEILIYSPASDAAVADIDGDGDFELGIISPFHGNKFDIYKKVAGKWEIIYSLPGNHAFGHALYGGEVFGKQSFLVGFRAEGQELYLISRENESIVEELIENNKGPANVTVVKGKHSDYVCIANRQSDICSIYTLIN